MNDFEKQKEKVKRAMGETIKVTEDLCRISADNTKMYEMMHKNCEDGKMELRRRLDRSGSELKNLKFGEMDAEEFNRETEKQLNSLVEKFKVEAESMDLQWIGKENIRHILCNFEEIIKIILAQDSTLEKLTERLLHIVDKNEKVCNFTSNMKT